MRAKKDGKYRMILNLKRVNSHVIYHYFKMDTLLSAMAMMRPNCFIVSVDLKDAYYSVPVYPEDYKYLKFQQIHCFYKQFMVLSKTIYCNK